MVLTCIGGVLLALVLWVSHALAVVLHIPGYALALVCSGFLDLGQQSLSSDGHPGCSQAHGLTSPVLMLLSHSDHHLWRWHRQVSTGSFSPAIVALQTPGI